MTQQLSNSELQQQIDNLEIKLAFQEDTIEAMEKTLVLQQTELQKLEHKLSLLSEYLKSLHSEVAAVKPLNEETPPPHY